jgi:LAGLIDADG DNA endonuclease family
MTKLKLFMKKMNNNKNNKLSLENYKIAKLLVKKGPNSKSLKEYKKTLINLSPIQWETGIGLMLGDASLQSQNKGKTYRMKFEWGDKNKLYAEHIHNLFNEWILSPLYKKSRLNSNGKIVITWSFQTFSHEAFNSLKDLFLINNHKGITKNLIKDHLTGRGLAYWFMDDGGKLDYNKNTKNRGLVLNTHNFKKEEVEMMSIELNDKFDLDTSIRINKDKYVIIIKSDKYDKFKSLTHSYILPAMKYKLPIE